MRDPLDSEPVESGRRLRIWAPNAPGPAEVTPDTLAYLIDTLRTGGLVQRDDDTRLEWRSPMADVGEKLRKLAWGEGEDPLPEDYRPDADDRRVLTDVLNFWMNDIGRDKMPEDAVTLRDLLVDYP